MIIVKIGGGESLNIEGIVKGLKELTEPYLIVHGANSLRDSIAESLGKPPKILTSVSGYSSVYSDKDLIDHILMAYAGLRNKRIVESCRMNRIDAVGLTGLDGGIVCGIRNKGIRIVENGKKRIVRDFSGKPEKVNAALLRLLIDNGYVPVLTIPIADEFNQAVNSENDDIVRLLQSELNASRIFQFIEAPGLLSDPADPESMIKQIPAADLPGWEEKSSGRFKRKVRALRKITENGTCTILIGDGRVEDPVGGALAGNGTIIT